ncbi:MAG: hypothetical protein INR73_09350 [Williamsia sp.]|nr:hypothetical protein [Williamsia sp.]
MKRRKSVELKNKLSRILSFSLLLFFAGAAGTSPLSAQAPAQTAATTVYEDVPDMNDQDIDLVMTWIKSRVALIKTPYCWKDSKVRGAGVLRSVCADGLEKSTDLLCYPKCDNGFSGTGPVCWQDCPSGFRNDGAYCAKTTTYSRGIGRTPDLQSCSDWNPDYRDDGSSCYLDPYGRGTGRNASLIPCSYWNSNYRDDGSSCYLDPYGRGTGRSPDKRPCSDWSSSYRDDGTSCYADTKTKKLGAGCDAQYHAVGCCLCEPDGGPGLKVNVSQRYQCRPDEDYKDGLCYPKCKSGYHNDGCCICTPDGGPGLKVNVSQRYQCGADEDLVGATCYPKCKVGYYADVAICTPNVGPGLKVNVSQRYQCKPDEELKDATCYPKCQPGFHLAGGNICSQDCFPGSDGDIGVSCKKKTQGRGVGQTLLCAAGTIPDETGGPAGLCFPKCNTGYHGIGPVCWQNCPNGSVECGAGCAKSAQECATTTFDQVFSVAMLAINIATFGSTSAAKPLVKKGEEAVEVAGRFAVISGGLTKVQKTLWASIDALSNAAGKVKDIEIVKRVMKVYNENEGYVMASKGVIMGVKAAYYATKGYKDAYVENFAALTSPEINAEIDLQLDTLTAKFVKETWADLQITEMAQTNGFVIAHEVLSTVSSVDPTGVLGVVDAYTKPVCGANMPWPILSKPYKFTSRRL